MARVDPLARLVQVLGRFPGIGEKTATRLAFFVLKQGQDFAREMAEALLEATDRVGYCSRCQNLTDEAMCRICTDPKREPTLLCVVEQVQDLRAIERSREYRGRYHVLHGAIAPLEGMGPEDIKIKELFEHLASQSTIKEVILATNPSVEGEATALYLQRMLTPMGYKVTRIASGLPIGSDLEFADAATIAQALLGRRLLD